MLSYSAEALRLIRPRILFVHELHACPPQEGILTNLFLLAPDTSAPPFDFAPLGGVYTERGRSARDLRHFCFEL